MMNNSNYETFADFFKAIAHPVRLQILDILREKPACVCHINAILDQRQAYISQQLAVLKDAGIVESEKDGWNVYYSICEPGVLQAMDDVRGLVAPDFEVPVFGVVENCPCPACLKA